MAAIVVSSGNLMSTGDGDVRFIRRDASTVVAAGVTLYFADGASNIRIKNGQLQMRVATTGLWHQVIIRELEPDHPEIGVSDGPGEN